MRRDGDDIQLRQIKRHWSIGRLAIVWYGGWWTLDVPEGLFEDTFSSGLSDDTDGPNATNRTSVDPNRSWTEVDDATPTDTKTSQTRPEDTYGYYKEDECDHQWYAAEAEGWWRCDRCGSFREDGDW